ncbi:SH2 domain-containing adapter protein E-like [Sardina pilchardus]|uniref:SH2 domain-containing adapter protein E-like n=1 Tax=Sardina pilchardus TaxID=27697 RepID=UPI002E10966B
MALGEAYVPSPISPQKIAMARWFKEFPINFRNGTDKIRSVSESDSQSRDKPAGTVGMGTATRGSPRKGSGVGRISGGVSCLLSGSGRNRKNSTNESCHSVNKDEKVWDSLLSGKSRKNSKSVAVSEEHNRTLKNCISAGSYITRLIKVEKQDRIQNPSNACTPPMEETNKGTMVGKTETLIIREDYADPFDAQRNRKQSVSPGRGENDGYMEPYDAQQLITEIRRRGSKDLLKMSTLPEGGEGLRDEPPPRSSHPLQIYDDPYEGAAETPVSRPESDPRSPAEYELPWEWRREQILKALSVPFDDAADHPAPAREEAAAPHLSWPQMHHLQHWSWSQRAPRPPQPSSQAVPRAPQPSSQAVPRAPQPSSQAVPRPSPPSQVRPSPSSQAVPRPPQPPSQVVPRPPPPSTQAASRPPTPSQSGGGPACTSEGDGCRVDPSVPLETQSWYHGSVTRQEVDSQLQSCKEGSFLVRDSESGTSKYSIALKTSQGCVHIIVAQTKESGFTLDQSRCTFPSIPQVVHFYCTQPLPFPGANHMTLRHPVPRPL